MAREASEVAESLALSVKASDPSIDVVKGPIFNFMIQPVSNEIARVEAEAERIQGLFSLEFVEVATDEEVEAFGRNFATERGPGERSQVRLTFFTFTRPIANINIPLGTQAATADRLLIYRTILNGIISGNTPDSFFNAAKNRFEITIQAEAINVGETFNIPSGRINTLIVDIENINGVENLADADGGLPAEDNASMFIRVQKKFQGLNSGTLGGIESIVRDFRPSVVKDVSIVQPKERNLFRRFITRPAFDIYVIGEDRTEQEDTFTAVGGETTFILSKQPVIEILELTVNDNIVDFSFIPDSNVRTRKSTASEDSIVLDTPLIGGDILFIKYDYNALLEDLQNEAFSGSTRLFDTDILIRQAIDTLLTIEIDAKIVPSFDPSRVQDDISDKTFEVIETNLFVDAVFPEIVRQEILSSIAGITTLNFSKFTKTLFGTLDVEVVEFALNEIPKIDPDNFIINVRS